MIDIPENCESKIMHERIKKDGRSYIDFKPEIKPVPETGRLMIRTKIIGSHTNVS
jgi:hypothetical protein